MISNLKDFPSVSLRPFAIEAQHPDLFISNLIKVNQESCVNALNNQIQSLKNPPKSKEDVLNALIKCGLINSAKILR